MKFKHHLDFLSIITFSYTFAVIQSEDIDFTPSNEEIGVEIFTRLQRINPETNKGSKSEAEIPKGRSCETVENNLKQANTLRPEARSEEGN